MAADQQSSNLGVSIIEAEGTYKTDAIDAAITANEDLVYQAFTQCDITPVSQIVEMPQVLPAFSGVPHEVIKDHVTVAISGILRGATNPGNAGGESPNYADIFGAMNLSQTVASGTSLTLAPSTVMQDAISVYRYMQNLEDAKQRLIYALGVRGNGVFNFNLNQYAGFQFNGLGASFPESTDTADFHGWSSSQQFLDASAGDIALDKAGSAVTYTGSVSVDQQPPLMVQNITVTADAVTYRLESLTMDLRWTPTPVNTVSGTENVYKVILTRAPGVRPGGTMVLADTGAAFSNAIQNWLDADEVSASVALTNGVDDYDLTIPKLQLRMPSPGDNGGVRNWSIDYDMNGDYASSVLGNNEFSGVFSAT